MDWDASWSRVKFVGDLFYSREQILMGDKFASQHLNGTGVWQIKETTWDLWKLPEWL